jgi:hypothetical protein
MAQTRVYWKWEDEGDEGEPVGPVIVGPLEPDGREEEWDRWVTRTEAAEYARQNGFEFFADE